MDEVIYENETAEELYERIQREKEKLILEGKLKKQKKLPEISEDEIPFEIPKSWKWVRLGEISNNIHYGYTASASLDGDSKLLRITDIQDNRVNWNDVPYCYIDNNQYLRYSLRDGDILIARTGGTVGKSYMVESLLDRVVFASYLIRIILSNEVYRKYIKYFMESALYWNQLKSGTTGTGQPNVNAVTLGKLLVPLPPLSEQKRISDLIDRLFEKLDEAKEKALSALNTFELRKAKILHLAIQGKLSKQLDEYGMAEGLYEKIQHEKEKLISEGKLKKQKKLPEISEDEIPFEIPKSWKWVRLGEIGEIVGGGTPKTNNIEFWKDGNIAWITPADMKNVSGKYVSFGERNITEKGLNSSSAKLMPKHSVIYSSRAPIGYVAIANNSLSTNQGFKSIVPYEFKMDKFLYYCLIDRTEDIIMRATGTTFKEISGSEFGKTIIPLPPLGEQKEIVELLDNIFEKEEKSKKLIQATLDKIEIVKKSILNRAVRGEF